jgi:ribosome-binding factor A
MVNTKRIERLNDQIRMEIADILMTRVKDPRVGFVTVTAVETSPDLRNARIFVTIMAEGDALDKSLEGLRKAAAFIRSELGRRLHIRFIPELFFEVDHSAEESERVLKLLEEIQKSKSHEP